MKAFLTGATGYVGGQALYNLSKSGAVSPSNITCLVRDENKAGIVQKAYPGVKVVIGDLDDVQLVEKQSQQADIVLHLASTKHLASSEAIARGLGKKAGQGPGYWVQISGASLFAGPEIAANKYGEASDASYNDLADTAKIIKVIQTTPTRVVDNLVVSQSASQVRTALVIGPLIYGRGEGPVNQRSVQAPDIARYTLKLGEGFRLGAGTSRWSNIHVADMGDLIVKLVEAAAENKEGVWNHDGIYLPANGIMTFGDLGQEIARQAHIQGLVKDATITKTIDAKEANEAAPHGAVLWGTNAICTSSRANDLLGWSPSRPALQDVLAEVVSREAESMKAAA